MRPAGSTATGEALAEPDLSRVGQALLWRLPEREKNELPLEVVHREEEHMGLRSCRRETRAVKTGSGISLPEIPPIKPQQSKLSRSGLFSYYKKQYPDLHEHRPIINQGVHLIGNKENSSMSSKRGRV
jgi:hypothetical protein